MHITWQPTGDLLEMQLDGMLDSAAADHLRDEFEKAIGQGRHRILLDFGRVTYISSAGISMLLKCRKQVQAIHGDLGVCHLTPQVEQVLRMMRIDRGATAGFGDDFFEWGRQSGRLAAKVLAGVPVRDLDFEKTAVQKKRVRDDAAASRGGS